MYKKGKAGASSCFSGNRKAQFAFLPEVELKIGWGTKRNEPLPAHIWYEFERLICPGKIMFRPLKKVLTPKEYQFIGSNDQECKSNSNWEALCEKSNEEFSDFDNDWEGCEVDASKVGTEKYRCLGLKILATGNNRGAAALSSIKIFSSDVCY